MINKTKIISALAFGLLVCTAANAFDRIQNYTRTNGVNDVVSQGDTLWIATTGGLYCYDRVSRSGTLLSDPALFPDPELTALCLDSQGTLWIGSSKGYLYKRAPAARQTVISAYVAASWHITTLVPYGSVLFVGSNNGIGVFNTQKLIAEKNASVFGDGIEKQVNCAAVIQDTLLLGMEQGVLKLCIGGKKLADTNFSDPSIWTRDSANMFPVKSFALGTSRYRALQVPGAVFRGRVVTCSTRVNAVEKNQYAVVYRDTATIARLPSPVMNVRVLGNECFFGTRDDYLYSWNGQDSKMWQIAIPGPTFSRIDRVYVDHEGSAWVCPAISNYSSNPWWEGFSVFKNGTWRLFSPKNTPSLGPLTGNIIKGACEDRLGNMWFGTEGSSVKQYNSQKNAWQIFCILCQDFNEGKFYTVKNGGPCWSVDWAMSDAIACDSSGYVWMGVYSNVYGSLVCYDPKYEPNPAATSFSEKHYRRFWEKGDPNWTGIFVDNISYLNVDRDNNIIAGHQSGKIVVFNHLGDPLGDGVRIKAVYSENTGKVLDMISTRDGLTWIVATSGIYTFVSLDNSFHKGLFILVQNGSTWSLQKADSSVNAVTALEMEDDGTLWLGTVNGGLVRLSLASGSKTIVSETQGLLSNNIIDLSMDKLGGYLWVATDRGASRYSIGYRLDKKNTSGAAAFPNPYSKLRHTQLVFSMLPPNSTVLVYTLGGSLVASLTPENNSTNGSVCVWNPPRQIVPGIYLYTVRSRTKNSQGKFVITP